MSAPIAFTASAQFFGQTLPIMGPNTLYVTQEEYLHDTAVLNFWLGDVNADSFYSGMPVVIQFGRNDVRRAFYGYVNHAYRTNNALLGTQSPSDRNSATVVCVGASWWMRQNGTRTWFNRTASQVVSEIAGIFGLGMDVDMATDQTVWPSLQMAGRSYWQFCVSLAKSIGYTFYCNGATLVFKPRQINVRQINGTVIVYDYRRDPSSVPIFTPTLGVESPALGRWAVRKAVGVNPRTGTLTYSEINGSNTPTAMGTLAPQPIFTKVGHRISRSQEELNVKNSADATVQQLYISATAHASGNPIICQGSLVRFLNVNGSQNGLWYVVQAEHRMDTTTYTTDMVLGRDSLGDNPVIGFVPQTSSSSNPTLIQGRWMAAA